MIDVHLWGLRFVAQRIGHIVYDFSTKRVTELGVSHGMPNQKNGYSAIFTHIVLSLKVISAPT